MDNLCLSHTIHHQDRVENANDAWLGRAIAVRVQHISGNGYFLFAGRIFLYVPLPNIHLLPHSCLVLAYRARLPIEFDRVAYVSSYFADSITIVINMNSTKLTTFIAIIIISLSLSLSKRLRPINNPGPCQ